jgi:hypothetical protein
MFKKVTLRFQASFEMRKQVIGVCNDVSTPVSSLNLVYKKSEYEFLKYKSNSVEMCTVDVQDALVIDRQYFK